MRDNVIAGDHLNEADLLHLYNDNHCENEAQEIFQPITASSPLTKVVSMCWVHMLGSYSALLCCLITVSC